MRRDSTGRYETSVAGGESVRALVPIDPASFIRDCPPSRRVRMAHPTVSNAEVDFITQHAQAKFGA